MIRRLAFALTAAALAALPARAQVQYPVNDSAAGAHTAPGFVNLCPTAVGTFVPCGTAGALPISGGPTAPGTNDIGGVFVSGYRYTNITTQTTTVIKTGAGVLHTVCVNTQAATGTITIYDNTAGSGTKIGLATSVAGIPGCLTYDVAFVTGLTIVTATASPDVTVSWR